MIRSPRGVFPIFHFSLFIVMYFMLVRMFLEKFYKLLECEKETITLAWMSNGEKSRFKRKKKFGNEISNKTAKF